MLIAHLSDPHLCPPGELYQSVLDTRPSFADIPALTAPATSTSLALRLARGAEPASFTEPAVMLLHHWTGGQLTTHFQPIGHFPGPHVFF